MLRAEYRACSELLAMAIAMLHDQAIELDRVRTKYYALLAERRDEGRAA